MDSSTPRPPTSPDDPAGAAPGTDDRLLAHPAFARFLFARFTANVVVQMVSVAVGVQIYDRTGQALDLAWIGLVQFLPMLLLAIHAGGLADRGERRVVATVADLGYGACALGLLWMTWADRVTLPSALAVLTCFGVARAYYGPAVTAMLPQTVPTALLSRAVATQSAAWQIATIAGPALAGGLYAIGRGPHIVYALAAVLAVVAALAMIGVMRQSRDPEPGQSLRIDAGPADAWSGLRYVWAHPLLFPALLLDFLAVLLGGATALIPVFATDVLHRGPEVVGMLRAAPGIGAAAIALLLVRYPLSGRIGPLLLGSVALFGVATIAFGASTSLWLSLGALVVAGAADMLSAVVRATLVQIATPPDMRGRVSAVNLVFIGASNELGEVESGLAAHWLGAVRAVVYGGLGTLVIVAAATARYPRLRQLDRMLDATP